MNPIQPILPPVPLQSLPSDTVSLGKGDTGSGFSRIFEQAVARVEQYQQENRAQVDKFLAGEDVEVHDVVLATQKAELAFEMFLQVRNKVVQAYQEIMRMQL